MNAPKPAAIVALAIIATFAVVACSGSGAASAGAPTPANATPAASDGGSAVTPAPSEAGAATPVPAPGTVDPCTLLTAADLKTATGKDYVDGVADGYGGCSWNIGTLSTNQGDLVYATVQQQTLALIKSSFIGGVDATVSGHAAYWNPAAGLQSIWVDVDGQLLVLSFPSSSDLTAADQTIAQKLAEVAVGRM